MIQNPVNQKDLSQPGGGYMEHEKLTEKIIGCAYRVYNRMGFGFLKSATGKPVGLILNFGERKVEIKRKIRELL